MHRGQRVPLAAPAEDRVTGQIRQVRDRAVGVAERVRILTAPVRLDAVAHLALGVGGAALGPVVLDREVAVRALAVHDPVGADDARVADVDHVRVADVQADAKAGDEHRRRGEHPHRPHRRPARRVIGARDPHATKEQPRERRIREQHRSEDVAVVEVPKGDREREQHDEVDVAHRERAAPVGEPEQEERAERQPEPGAVDRRTAERALVAARHLPGDLRPGPGRSDRAARIVDRAGRDLARLARPDVHRPNTLRESRVGDRSRRVALQPARNFAVAEEELDRLLLRRARRRLGGGDLRCRDRRRGGRPRARRRNECERQREDCGESHLRNDQSLLPRKFSGVTRTIAIACDITFCQSSTSMKRTSQS